MKSTVLLLVSASFAWADGPRDNQAETVRPVPPKGAAVAEKDRVELQAGLDDFGREIASLKSSLKPALVELIPDVEIFHKAVLYALKYDEIYVDKNRDDVKTCRAMLKLGRERAQQLRDGKPLWPVATGLIVRGYRSKIDESVQPYGLVVPASFNPNSPHRWRADFWWHGRGELLTEANFIEGRLKTAGEFTPRDAFVVHPYGRYCNANKFAGEVDTFEVLDHLKKHYPIDTNKLVARGFSMGGAACWQFATHFPTTWIAAAPGAGFAETPEFLKVFQNETVKPTWYEEKLWGLYNATDYSVNIMNVPTVAYSGENDRQKQAADIMAKKLSENGIELTHIIGPKTGHSYEKNSKIEIDRRIDAIVAAGRKRTATPLLFTTQTLRYNRAAYVEILGLKKHWEPAIVRVEFDRPDLIKIGTANVSSFRINFGPGEFPFESFRYRFEVIPKELLGEDFKVPPIPSDRSYSITIGEVPEGLAKVPGLQGPIDDAFMDHFIMVEPTQELRQIANGEINAVDKWVDAEMKRAIREWRRVFRGDAIVRRDDAVSDADIASSNLILWGTPQSNSLMKKIIGKLPLKWNENLEFGGKTYNPQTHVPIMIFPNPLNPKKYVVINSGFTFREYDALNNARQVPKLPDYAIVDVTPPPNARTPGNIVRAGFFDEQWKLQTNDGK